MADKAERRPRRKGGAPDDAQGDGITVSVQRDCPLVRAALHLNDPRVIAVVARVHPALCCPAARREATRDR